MIWIAWVVETDAIRSTFLEEDKAAKANIFVLFAN